MKLHTTPGHVARRTILQGIGGSALAAILAACGGTSSADKTATAGANTSSIATAIRAASPSTAAGIASVPAASAAAPTGSATTAASAASSATAGSVTASAPSATAAIATPVAASPVSGTRAASGSAAASSVAGGTASTAARPAAPLVTAACEDFWGSVLAQIGSERVTVTNVIADPSIDPHDYEPKPTDARLFAGAKYVVVNGAGYDPWAPKLIDANPVPGRKVLTVADLFGKKDGDNPHLWYNPDYVVRTAKQITTDLKSLDAAGASYFDAQSTMFLTVSLKPYMDLITTIKQRYQGTPVGASESIFVYLSDALGLKLLTPPSFLEAINDGSDPSPQDKATIDQQITQKQIKVYVYNSQNTTPDVDAQKNKAQSVGIPVVAITETPDPPSQSLQDWQTAQLRALQDALAKATGK